jgi:hypothetical protein
VADPAPRIDLATALDVRREMAIVYRDMKAKKPDPSDGTKLVYVLAAIGKMIEIHEMERGLTELEERLAERMNGARELPPLPQRAH